MLLLDVEINMDAGAPGYISIMFLLKDAEGTRVTGNEPVQGMWENGRMVVGSAR